MATQTMPYVSSAGGLVTIDLRYDDQTGVVAAIVVTNGSTDPCTFTMTDADTGAAMSRTWQAGQSETLSIPGGYRVSRSEFGQFTSSFANTFTGSSGD